MEDNKREESVKDSASNSSTNRIIGLIGLMVILLLFVGAIVLLGRDKPNEQLETDVSGVAAAAAESEAPSESASASESVASDEVAEEESGSEAAASDDTEEEESGSEAAASEESNEGEDESNEGEDEAVAASGRFLGSPDAPLLIKDFSDFRCPHCRDAAYNLTPKIIDEYVKKGLVRLEFIPVVVTSEEGLYGGMAALCAEEQGQFWAYHDILFERQGEEEFNLENLERFAEELSMDAQPFHDCMLSGKFGEQLLANNEQFQQSGATGTPTFIIGDELTVGGLPFEEIQKTIEAQLNQ
ncbi:MAG: DsbA family protein [Ardenticatenaceae bacterium]